MRIKRSNRLWLKSADPKILRAIFQIVDYLLVFLLIGLWGIVFLPATLRSRQTSSPINSIGTFRRGMRALSAGGIGRSGGRWVVMPKSRADIDTLHRKVMWRRRRVLIALIWAVVGTGLTALIPGARFVATLHVAADVLLVVYVLVLLRIKNAKPRASITGVDREAHPIVDTDETPEEDYLRVEHF